MFVCVGVSSSRKQNVMIIVVGGTSLWFLFFFSFGLFPVLFKKQNGDVMKASLRAVSARLELDSS